MADNKIAAILVELDALLDSRLATLRGIDPKAVDRMLKSGYYNSRTEDVFPGVDAVAYREAYAKRNFETLASYPIMTGMVPVLRDLVGSYSVDSVLDPAIDSVKVVVMTHPYDLTSDEKQALHDSLSYYLSGMATIEFTNLTYSELTPQHCNANYRDMVFYNFLDWAKSQETNIQSRRIPTVRVIVPAFQYIPLDPEIAEELKERGVSVFTAAQEALRPIAKFDFIDARFFSAINPAVYTASTNASPPPQPRGAEGGAEA